MLRRSLIVLLALLASLAAGAAFADDARDEMDRFAFGLGLGLVDLSDSRAVDSTETYLHASLRILMGDKDRDEGGRGPDDGGWVTAYVEPELGYWERGLRIPLADGSGEVNSDSSDLMIGLNLIGVVPFRKVDYFFGAGVGIHFFDVGLDASNVDVGSEETFGVNVQVGIDVHVSEAVGFFGLLRLDLVEESVGEQIGEEQAKIVLGARFFFG